MFTVNSLKSNFHFMQVCTFKLRHSNLWLLNLQGLVIAVHMPSLQLNYICKLTAAMIDESSSGFNLCRHKKYSLPSTLILYRLCENLLEC